jgi:hypothetical protein
LLTLKKMPSLSASLFPGKFIRGQFNK